MNEGKKNSFLKKSVNWLIEQASGEWYESPEKLDESIKKDDKGKRLLEEETFVRLNTGLFAKILMDQKQYDAYYVVFNKVLSKFFKKKDLFWFNKI